MKSFVSALVAVIGLAFAAPAANSLVQAHIRNLGADVPAVRRRAATALGRYGERGAVSALVAALADPVADVRAEAAKALGYIKDRRAVEGLIRGLGDKDVNVRFDAAYALGEIKDSTASGSLLAALGDPEWSIRDQAAWALRELNDPATAAPLVEQLRAPDADVEHIVWILRQIGGENIVSHLAGLLRDPDPDIRIRAVGLLGEAGDPRAVEPLIEALGTPEARVRLCVIRALAGLGDDRALGPLRTLGKTEADAANREAIEKTILKLSRHPSLVGHWSFDDRNTEVAADVTGNGSRGRIRGCSPVAGKIGAALEFGKNRFIELGQPSRLPIGQRPFTVSAWVKSSAANGVVVARGGAFCGYSLYIKDGVAKFGIHRFQDGPAYIAAGEENVVGRWVHLAGVVKAKSVEVYVDGKPAGTAKTPGYLPGNCGQGMEIGFDAANSPAEITDSFEGIIDEVKMFHAALSQAEIAKEHGLAARSAEETQ